MTTCIWKGCAYRERQRLSNDLLHKKKEEKKDPGSPIHILGKVNYLVCKLSANGSKCHKEYFALNVTLSAGGNPFPLSLLL